jgi:serine/threonine-protein kinase
MSCVYEAEHTVLRQRLVLKFIAPEYTVNRETLRRFQNEARSASHIEHPNIATVRDLGSTADGSAYVVRDYLTGVDCGQLLSTGPLPIARACDMVHQACVGLSVAHQAGIVHRDIKLTNLFVTRPIDGSELVKILDFGVARLRVLGATGSGAGIGALAYLAPEQVRDAGRVDGRADIWALGVVLYELLTGRKPFDGPDGASVMYQIGFEAPEPPNDLRPELPLELISAIDLALEKDPEKRFETVLAFGDAIGPFTGRPPSRTSSPAVSQRPPLLTPVDAAYDTTQGAVSVVTNAPVSRSLTVRRQRAYRVYTLLALAALVGFGGGGLTRRIVSRDRAAAAAAAAAAADNVPPATPAVSTEILAAQDSTENAPAVVSVAASAPAASGTAELGAVAAASAAALGAAQNAPLRLVRASPDAGTLRAEVESAQRPTAVPSTIASTALTLGAAPSTLPKPSGPKPSAPTSSAPVQSPAGSVPEQANVQQDAPPAAAGRQ